MLGRRTGITIATVVTLVLLAVVAADTQALAGGRRGHYSGHHRGGHHDHGYYYQPFRPYRHFGWGLGLAALSLHYSAYDHGRRVYVYDRDRPEYSEVETDVKPSSASVYVDGDPVGIADDFNGWPSRLRLEPGRHELLFRETGYAPLRVEVDVLPYHTLRINERMARGSDAAEPVESGPVRTNPRSDAPRESVRSQSSARGSGIILIVDPADATVYVDGELIDDRSGALQRHVVNLAPGTYRIEVAKPGYQAFTGEVTLRERQRQELTVRLDRSE